MKTLIGALLFLTLVPFQASAEIKTEVSELLLEMEQKDFRLVSAAAQKARNYAYKEVADKLIELLSNPQVTDGNPSYAFVISYAVDSLLQMGSLAERQALIEAEDNIQRILRGTRSEQVILKLYRTAVNELSLRRKQLPVLGLKRPVVRNEPRGAGVAAVNGMAPIRPLAIARAQGAGLDVQRLEDQIAALKLEGPEALYFQRILIDQLEKNIYDLSVDTYNSGRPFTKYLFRDDDLERLLQAMLRSEKGHALLTGKAGVGKTTLLKMLQNGWVSGELAFPGNNIPIVLELSILDITNPGDPTAIKERIKAAQKLAEKLDTHIVLFIDESHVATSMARNAIKGFLSEPLGGLNRVHFVWATTSTESRGLLGDSAFARRWVEVHVKEFTDEQAIEAVRAANLEDWKRTHSRGGIEFAGVTPDAWSFAIKYRHIEQPHAGNPTGLKELLEGTIVHRLRELERQDPREQKSFEITPDDIRAYLKFQKGRKLIPGDPDFEENFESMWTAFRKDYLGQDGAMFEMKRWLRTHFGSLVRPMMLVIADFGPPGVGKSFSSEMLAKHFFEGAILDINAGMFSEGSFPVNVLIGSPTGTVGSEEQRSILTNFIRKYPNGGIINIEEADYLPQQVMDFLVDMITKKKFIDGLGQEWSTENFVIKFNSNIGQDLLIRPGVRQRTTWDDFEIRKTSITHKVRLDDKEEISVIRPDKLDEVFEKFVAQISKGRREHKETTAAQQAGLKLKRRIKAMYSLLPDRHELAHMGQQLISRYLEDKKREYGVKFVFEGGRATIDALMDLDHYRFEEGYSYVQSRLTNYLFFYLDHMLDRKGKTVKISIGERDVQIGRRTVKGQTLILKAEGEPAIEHSLGTSHGSTNNQWFNNEQMRDRIRDFSRLMGEKIKGKPEHIQYMAARLKEKLLDWNTKLNLTLLGTSGNGKTEFGFALAETLFGSRDAAYKLSGLNTWADLQNHFRSPVGFVGSNEETEFERWFMSRKNAGGGVIILDELLSLSELSREAIAAKVEIINKLYDLLDERVLRFKNRTEDANAFIVLISGNALQELFDGLDDSPEAEALIQKIRERITTSAITEALKGYGIDAPKQSRLGRIFVDGPLSKEFAYEVGLKDLDRSIQGVIHEVAELFNLEVEIDPEIVKQIVDRVTTVRLGMRFVNAAINSLIKSSVAAIIIDLDGPSRVEAKLVKGKIVWTADGQKIERVALPIRGSPEVNHVWMPTAKVPKHGQLATPQLSDVEEQPKDRLTDEMIHMVGVHEIYGHWMTDVLLTGKNESASISLIPGRNSFGYVRKKIGLPQDVIGLTEILRRTTSLEAGHRAVFLEGIFAVGGGADRGRDKGPPRDDLGKVEELLKTVLSNNLVEGYGEFDGAEDGRFLKGYLRTVGKSMADQVISYGRSIGKFDEFFDKITEKRFASEEMLDGFAEQVARLKLEDPDILFHKALANAVRFATSHSTEIERAATLGRQILEQASKETISMGHLRGTMTSAKEKQIRSLTDKAAGSLANLKGKPVNGGPVDCEALLFPIGGGQ